jgi:hypothetical protein
MINANANNSDFLIWVVRIVQESELKILFIGF